VPAKAKAGSKLCGKAGGTVRTGRPTLAPGDGFDLDMGDGDARDADFVRAA
jgi:methyl-accepting chemotaxis protein